MSKAEKIIGRPKGSLNKEQDHVQAIPTHCIKCASTEREAYNRSEVQEFSGVDPQGNPYTHIVRRWTRCSACGQHRIDRYYENR